MTDALLVKRAKHGDAQAFATLYEQIHVSLYQFALYTLRNPHDAEDAVSETITEGFAQIHKLRRDEAFSSWMFSILSNICNRHLRQYYHDRQTVSIEASDTEGFDTALNIWEYHEEHMDLRECFFRLGDKERMILSLHVFGGYKTREIAQILQMNENTVRSKERRALGKLRKMLEE